MVKKLIIYVFQLIPAYMLFNAGVMKYAGYSMEIALFTKIGMEPHGRFIIGTLELLAAVLLVIPQSGIYGAILGMGIMFGAIIGHLTDIGMGGISNALLVLGCCLVTIYLRRNDASIIKNMIGK